MCRMSDVVHCRDSKLGFDISKISNGQEANMLYASADADHAGADDRR